MNLNLDLDKEKIIKYKNEELKLFKNKKEDINNVWKFLLNMKNIVNLI